MVPDKKRLFVILSYPHAQGVQEEAKYRLS